MGAPVEVEVFGVDSKIRSELLDPDIQERVWTVCGCVEGLGARAALVGLRASSPERCWRALAACSVLFATSRR